MATATVCLHNKFGHCKYKNLCRLRHVNAVCETESCDVRKCDFRHPKICRFFRDYGRCRFSPCSYQHDGLSSATKCVKEMKDELEKKNEEINELKILLKANVKKLEELTEKMFNLEKTVMKLNTGNQSHVNEMESCQPKTVLGIHLKNIR